MSIKKLSNSKTKDKETPIKKRTTNLSRMTAEITKRSFVKFVKEFWNEVPGSQPLIWNWHMDVICEELEVVARRVFENKPKLYDLIINISPATSKSTLVSILYPCWIWANMPKGRIISASHATELVLDLSNKARQVIKGEKYQECFPDIILREDQDTKSYWANILGGDRYTCTVSGKSPIGFHAHWILVDDALDPKKATSEVELKEAQDFFDNVIPSRKVDKEVSVTILLMQRLHELDPTGHWLKQAKKLGSAKIKHFKLPAEIPLNEQGVRDTSIVIPQDLVPRYEENGWLMDPIRLSKEVLDELKAKSLYSYAGQYLQSPSPLGGGLFKETYFIQRAKASPYNSKRIRYWDRASSLLSGARTAGVLMARDNDNRIYVENVVLGQWEPKERNEQMKAAALRDRARYGPRNEPVIWIEREGGSSGRDAFREIARYLAGFQVREHNITGMGKKEVRAEPWSSMCASQNVWLVEDGCLIAGTLIETEHGLKKIEEINKGERVVTRNGLRRVKWAGKTKCTNNLVSVLFSNGAIVTGTPNHLVWTNNREWVALEDCTWYDRCIISDSLLGENIPCYTEIQKKTQRLSSLRGLLTTKDHICPTSTATLEDSYTELSGRKSMEIYPMAMKYITKTKLKQTIELKILNVLPKESIEDFIQAPIDKKSICLRSDLLQQNGILQKKEELVAPKQEKLIGRKKNIKNINASYANQCLLQMLQLPNIVLSNVWKNPITIKEPTLKKESASYVELCADQQIRKPKPVEETADRNYGIDVYDLKVEETHEFYANGILVHNSWDVEEYIREHCLFPNGQYLDMVDASSGAFTLLINTPRATGFRVLSGRSNKSTLKIYLCSKEQVAELDVPNPSLLISIHQPHRPIESLQAPWRDLRGSLDVSLGDASSEQFQERWLTPLEEYNNLLPEEVVMSYSQGKKIWNFILNGIKNENVQAIIIQDEGSVNGDKRGISIGYAICDALLFNREKCITLVGNEESKHVQEPPNKHIYSITKKSRSMVL